MANLKNVDVGGADFKGADLCGANVDVKRIEEADLSGAKCDGKTL